jgi:DNA ligase-1
MKCATWKGDRSLRYAHAKLDGHRVRIANNRVVRKIEDVTERCENAAFMRAVRKLPSDVIIEGELWVPGEPAAKVSEHLAERSDKLCLSAFVLPQEPADERLGRIATLCELTYGLDFAPFWPLYEMWHEGQDWSHNLMKLCDELRMLGNPIEGFVLKDGNWANWQKWKPVRTIDLVVTGFKDGKGKHEGFVGSLECSIGPHVIANVSGMEDEVRWMIDENKDLGRVVEVKYDRVDSKGRLRFPRFVRWRDDKRPEECSLDQDTDLQEKHGCL